MPKLTPTKEQLAIIDAAQGKEDVVISALAGTGKSSSLAMVAEQLVVPSLLLVFNKSAKYDADDRMPAHVTTSTTHSLAYRAIGHKYRHKLNRPQGPYRNVAMTGGEIGRALKIPPYESADGKWVTSARQGLLARKCVERYEQSRDKVMDKYHVPPMAKKIGAKASTLNYAKMLWKRRKDVCSNTLITHDTYMKLYQLSKPILNYKVIYLDEAQDTSACTFDIVENQPKDVKVILVGDSFQSIYGWRGSIDAMMYKSGEKLSLTKSFRFGDNVCKVANRILDIEDLRSMDGLHTVVGREGVVDREAPYTVLYRTNTGLLVDALIEIREGTKVNLEVNASDISKQLRDAQYLYDGEGDKVKHESLLMFADWAELKEEAKFGGELTRLVDIVESGDVEDVIHTLGKHRNTTTPHILMTTAHKSKGREWDQVILGDDFPSHYGMNGKWKGLSDMEKNTLYVAATRAKKVLEYNESVAEVFVQ